MGLILLGFIAVVLILILIVLIRILLCEPPPTVTTNIVESKPIEDLVILMRTQYEDELRTKREEELVERARKVKDKNRKPDLIQSSGGQRDNPVRVSSKQNELIPFGMSETDKKIWEEFNL